MDFANNPETPQDIFVVSTKFPCDEIIEGMENFRPDPVWRTTALGCKVLQLLQDMYNFQMIYENDVNMLRAENSTHPDIYARPIALSPHVLDYTSPMQAIIDRRYGFILRNDNQPIAAREFYSLPFSRTVWCYLLFMVFAIITPILYLMCRWEKRMVRAREEYTLACELLAVIGVCCQHIPPIKPKLASRRIAYLVFLMFAWLIFTYYSSNLLSHLVNDKEEGMSLTQLADSDYEFYTLDSIHLDSDTGLPWYASAYKNSFPRYEELTRKVETSKVVNYADGLTMVGTQKAALLSDYITIYPYIRKYMDNEAICQLTEIGIFSIIKEFICTSKQFPLKEEFKVGILKIKETGILKRIKQEQIYSAPKCNETQQAHACFEQIIAPLALLGCASALAAILVLVERAHYERNKVWPYVN